MARMSWRFFSSFSRKGPQADLGTAATTTTARGGPTGIGRVSGRAGARGAAFLTTTGSVGLAGATDADFAAGLGAACAAGLATATGAALRAFFPAAGWADGFLLAILAGLAGLAADRAAGLAAVFFFTTFTAFAAFAAF